MTARDKLEAELAKLRARIERRSEQDRADRRREGQIRDELWRLHLMTMIGVADGVMIRYRGWDRRIPDDARGTLKKVGRTRGDVDFGAHGKWSIPLLDLISFADADNRGLTLRIGGLS
ncbi:MAG: hypothetical protein SFX73_24690 [Kofleriaceae bacterium]|nr:hypothetical protein [Kofleriaceae bacterium]